MAERSLVEILLRARGGRQVQSETRAAAGGFDKLTRSERAATHAAGRFGAGVRTASRWAVRGGAAIGAGLTYELYRATDAWEQHSKITADTAQVLKTTGGVANVTAKHVDYLANSIQAKTAVDDDQVAAGENILLTFLKVRNEVGKGNKVYDRATHLAVDMAARFGGDTKRAFVQLGRALDDPIKGITALRRTGVSFTEAETKKIKTLEQTGHHLQAQKMILAALDKQVGGSARAQARPIDKLKQSWGDVEKMIGKGVSPVVNSLADDLLHLSDQAQPAFDKLGTDLDKLFSRKDLSLGQKLTRAGHITGKDLGPIVDEIEQGLKDAHLDQKLSDAVEWAIPHMADAFVHAGPKAVSAFVHGFEEAGPAGKLLIAWFTGKKLGLGGLAKSLIGGGAGGGLLSKGGSPANPMFVVDISSGGGKGWLKTAAKDAEKAGGSAGALALARKWGLRGLKIGGRFGGPLAAVVATADALANPASTGGHRRSDGTYADEIPLSHRNRVQIHHRRPTHVLAGPDPRGIFSGGARPGSGPVHHQRLRLVVPITLLAPNGKVLAETVAEHPDILAGAVHDSTVTHRARG